MLEALHPGRIDLGIGRAPGTDPATAAALRRSADGQAAVEAFPRDVLDIMSLLGDPRTDDGFADRFAATPAATSAPPVLLLGSSLYSAQLAGALGLPFAFAHHFSGTNTAAAVEAYRATFRPSAALAAPYLIITAGVLVAETAEEARWFARPAQLLLLALRSGRLRPLDTPEEADAHPQRDLAASLPTTAVIGTPDAAVAALEELVGATGADELMITTTTHALPERLRSLELLVGAWQEAAVTRT
jgi:luciferase family oxidoreductase group 1